MKYLVLVALLGAGGVYYYVQQQDASDAARFQQEEQASAAKPAPVPAPTPPASTYIAPSGAADDAAVDAARSAAVATSVGGAMGTVTTTDGQAYTNCKVLKWNEDGATFSCDEGIVEVPYWKMPPELQKQFGYSIEKAAAQARYDAQQAAARPTPNP